jgi:hypothetical protein
MTADACSRRVGEQRPEGERGLQVRELRPRDGQAAERGHRPLPEDGGGFPRQREWWDGNVLPSLVGGYLLTGAERRGPDELARGLYDAVKPQLYAHDRYADVYLRVPT